jgi:hypothetical protein
MVSAGGSTASALPASFGSLGTRAGQISINPGGIAVEQQTGDVYVADGPNSRIDKFGPEGEFILAWGWGVANGETNALQTCSTTCFAGIAGSGSGQFPGTEGRVQGIAVDNSLGGFSHGDVYVVDPGNNRVQKFGPDGEFLLMFGGDVNSTTKGDVCLAGEACQAGTEGPGPGQFEGLTGRSIAVDSTGTVYVGDRERVQRFSESGVQEGEFTVAGAGQVRNLAVDSAKDIYLWGGLQKGVHKYSPTGVELGEPRDEAGFPEALAVTIGPADELFVNDFEGCCGTVATHILGFAKEGEQVTSFGRAEGEQAPQLNGSQGIAYNDFTSAVYVVNRGAVRVLALPAPGPFVLLDSQAVAETQPTTAKLVAMINPEGGTATKYHFEYGTTTAYEHSTADEELTGTKFEDQSVGAPITELRPNTLYHFRVVAENAAKQKTVGPDQTFTTLPALFIEGESAVHVTSNSATLVTQINPLGRETRYHFEYGPTLAYGTRLPIPDGDAGAGSSDVTRSADIEALAPGSTYHYRVVASNELGTVVGPDHLFSTQVAATTPGLLDGRGWEMVSPSDKHGSTFEPISSGFGGLIQAASGGSAITYLATGPLTGNPSSNRSALYTQILSARGAHGWTSQEIATPNEQSVYNGPLNGGEYLLFSPDLSVGLLAPIGETRLSPLASEHTPYLREANGTYTPLVYPGNIPPGTKFGPEPDTHDGVSFSAASPDLNHLLLVSNAALTPGLVVPGIGETELFSIYEWTAGSLQLVSLLPNGRPAVEEGDSAVPAQDGYGTRHSISNDGNRVIWDSSERDSSTHLYVSDVHLGSSVQLDALQPGARGGQGTATYETANSDASKVFFLDGSQLTPNATSGQLRPDLYMCEMGEAAGRPTCALTDLTPESNPAESAGVAGVIETSSDGRYVYFTASGVLAPGALPGNCTEQSPASTCNLYVTDTDTGVTRLVARLSSEDHSDWETDQNAMTTVTAKTSSDGRYLAFMSLRSLTGYDNRDAISGQPDTEVYLYDAETGRLVCASCNPTGARPVGVFDTSEYPGLLVDPNAASGWGGHWLAGSIPGSDAGQNDFRDSWYGPQYISDSGRLFFNSADALVPSDSNGREDVYEYEPAGVGDCAGSVGCIGLLSGGTSGEESALLDASESGNDVFFLTAAALAPQDTDQLLDVYDAHVCTSSAPCVSSPETVAPPPCTTADSCKPAVTPQPGVFGTPASATFSGAGNLAPASPAVPQRLTRAQKLAKAMKACRRRHNRHKRTACERQARSEYGPVKARSTHHRNRKSHT